MNRTRHTIMSQITDWTGERTYRWVRRTLLAVAILWLTLGASDAAAQEWRAAAMAEHPALGSWVLELGPATTVPAPTLATFHSDGVYTELGATSNGGTGTWEPTGKSSVAVTWTVNLSDPTGAFLGSMQHHAALSVTDDGQVLIGPVTLEMIDATFAPARTVELGTVTGIRLVRQQPIEQLLAA